VKGDDVISRLQEKSLLRGKKGSLLKRKGLFLRKKNFLLSPRGEKKKGGSLQPPLPRKRGDGRKRRLAKRTNMPKKSR